MDSRRKVFDDDWNGTEFGFAVGSIKTVDGFCPIDKISVDFCGEGKELADGIGEITDSKMAEDKAKELGKKIFEEMEKFYNDLVSDFKDGTKDGEVMGKYTGTDACAQMNACLTAYAAKLGDESCVWPKAAEAAEGEMAAMGMDAEMADPAMMEGGDDAAAAEMGGEMAADAMMAAAKKMSLIADDAFGDAAGPAELPKLLLSLMFYHPVFGDAVKAQTMHFELGGDSKKSFAAVATIVGAYVKAGLGDAAPSFGMSVCTDEDIEELKEIAAAKTESALVFPGVVGAWGDEADAVGQCNSADGKKKVLFKFNGKCMAPAGDKLKVMWRHFAKVESFEDPAEGKDYYVCTLADFTEYAFENVAAYTAAVKEAAEKAAAVVDEVKDAMMEEKPADMMGEAGAEMGDGM